MANAINSNPGFLNTLYESGKTGVNWLSTNAQNLSASAGDTLSKVWGAVSEFFSTVAQTLGTWMNAAKDGLFAAKDQIIDLPRESKIVGAIGLAVATAAGFLIGKWNATPAAAATVVTPPAAAAAAPAAPAAPAAQAAPVVA